MAVAAPLYESGTLKHYEAIQTKYLDILKAVQHAEKSSKRKKKHIDELVSTDTWMWTALGALMRDRNDRDAPCLKKEELIRIVKWKITRGKTRPLLHFALNMNEKSLLEVSAQCFVVADSIDGPCSPSSLALHRSLHALDTPSSPAASSEAKVVDHRGGRLRIEKQINHDKETRFQLIRQTVKTLCELRGIGPATASGILAVYRPDIFCKMADEAIEGVGVQRKYTLNHYMDVLERVHDKAIELTLEREDRARSGEGKTKAAGVGAGNDNDTDNNDDTDSEAASTSSVDCGDGKISVGKRQVDSTSFFSPHAVCQCLYAYGANAKFQLGLLDHVTFEEEEEEEEEDEDEDGEEEPGNENIDSGNGKSSDKRKFEGEEKDTRGLRRKSRRKHI